MAKAKTRETRLNRKHFIAIGSLLAGNSQGQAAVESGIPRRTLVRLINEDEIFMGELGAARERLAENVLGEITSQIAYASKFAVTSLLEPLLMDTGDISAASQNAKTRAALGILSNLTRLKELVDLEERLSELEGLKNVTQ